MKTSSFLFCNISPLRLAALAAVMIVCIWACAGTPPSDETKPSETKQSSAETRSTPSSSPSSSGVQPAKESPETVTHAKSEEAAVHLIITIKTSLRAEPRSKAKIITRLKKGEKVTRLSMAGSWCKVELSDQTTGWVLKKHTREEK